ncbi:PilZ domain-containing protein [Sporolactobacillus terrae]|uniref:PilZ domain-containing protein n=1 Tax=Sporolactobacillus terrae TaxID=269673 RepID=UPI00111A5F6B|nr:PilZ domain-containing protein [Sporolactobacillus terrae]
MAENLNLLLGIGIEAVGLMIVIICCIRHYNKVITRDHEVITELRRRLYNQTAVKERRAHYRIKLDGEKCHVRILDFGEQPLQRLNNQSIDAEMLDLSIGGMKMRCRIDFPVKEKVLVAITFSEEDETPIHVKGIVKRKETKHGRRAINYGVQFTHLSAKKETEIQSYMNKKDLSRKQLVRSSAR